MSKTKCSYEYCRKEFITPVLVTNFSFTPRKETYYACPHCLTRIDQSTKTCECSSDSAEIIVVSENEKPEENEFSKVLTTEQGYAHSSVVLEEVTLKKIENLSKQKKDLMAELAELRNKATKKINTLEKEGSWRRKSSL